MPKRKSEDSYEKLWKKFKKLEKKLLRRRHSRSRSRSTSRSPDMRYQRELDMEDHELVINNGANDTVENNCEIFDQCEVADLEPGGNTEVLLDTQRGLASPESTAETNKEPGLRLASTVVAIPAVPSTSAQSSDAVVNIEEPESGDAILDGEILEILGEDPTISNVYGPEIHKDLALRLEHVSRNGLTKELRKSLNEKYLLPSNCKLICAPGLNAEIKAAISESNVKRDKNIEIRQKQRAAAISCLSNAVHNIITNNKNNVDSDTLKMQMDAERILCDAQHNDSVLRRNFILSSLKKDMKDQLQNTKPDDLLFGQNLIETIKTAKAISKSGAELKTPMPKQQYNQMNSKKPPAAASTSKTLNWKGPYPARKPPNHPKTKEPPQSKTRPSTSSRPSQQQPTRSRR